jgi:hypothetical protein
MIVPFSYPYFQEKKKKLLNSNKSPKSTATKMGSFFSDFVDNDSAPLQQQGLLHGGPALSSLQAAGVSPARCGWRRLAPWGSQGLLDRGRSGARAQGRAPARDHGAEVHAEGSMSRKERRTSVPDPIRGFESEKGAGYFDQLRC